MEIAGPRKTTQAQLPLQSFPYKRVTSSPREHEEKAMSSVPCEFLSLWARKIGLLLARFSQVSWFAQLDNRRARRRWKWTSKLEKGDLISFSLRLELENLYDKIAPHLTSLLLGRGQEDEFQEDEFHIHWEKRHQDTLKAISGLSLPSLVWTPTDVSFVETNFEEAGALLSDMQVRLQLVPEASKILRMLRKERATLERTLFEFKALVKVEEVMRTNNGASTRVSRPLKRARSIPQTEERITPLPFSPAAATATVHSPLNDECLVNWLDHMLR